MKLPRTCATVSLLLWFTGVSLFAQITLIPTGAVWKYFDNGSDQGSTWRGLLFDDASWGLGPGQLGYGDGDERTTNSFGLDPNNKYVTTYYRHSFTVVDPLVYTNVELRLLRDDGAIVYLNGLEVFRCNLPTGTVTYLTLAQAAAPDDGTFWIPLGVPVSSLRAGTNVVAVEIHQNSGSSSDLSFDFALLANVLPTPPLLSFTQTLTPPPFLEFTFNETGVNALNTGTETNLAVFLVGGASTRDLHSPDARGISGLPGDRAFDNTVSSGMGSAGSGGRAAINDTDAIDGLLSLTLQGWFKVEGAGINDLARLITKQSSATGFLLLGTGGNLTLEINNVGTTSTGVHYADAGTWIFFAVTYDGTATANNVRFYKGTRTNAVALVETRTLNQGRALENTSAITIGNANSDGSLMRPFDGWLDNFRVFGNSTNSIGALGLQQLEFLRSKDVQNLSDSIALSVSHNGALIDLTWPTYPGGFHLESKTKLNAGAPWTAVTNRVQIEANRNNVDLTASDSVRFFRLAR